MHITGIDAGYVHWAAVTKQGQMVTCSAGDDGYGGELEETKKAGGVRLPNAQGELGRTLPSGQRQALDPGGS